MYLIEFLWCHFFCRTFLKEQKGIREQIARMSSKPLFKVQEEVTALKQLLVGVSSGLHNNVAAIANLKQEASQVKLTPFLFFAVMETSLGRSGFFLFKYCTIWQGFATFS